MGTRPPVGHHLCPGDPGVPLDGGVSLLAGAAVMYGVKRLRKNEVIFV